MDCYGLCSQL
jgi:double-strand break repair protein MRE11